MKTHITLFTLALLAAFIPATPSSANCAALQGEEATFDLQTVTIDGVETEAFEAGNLLIVEGEYSGVTVSFLTDDTVHGTIVLDDAGGPR